jgi:pyruvate formate lyase activating enzyme
MEAAYYTKGEKGTAYCALCPRHCVIPVGRRGFCQTRWNDHGVLKARTYGLVSSAALDPIEKKPLAYFHPRSKILSFGSVGCNMCCPFCQNWQISQEEPATRKITPDQAVRMAIELKKEGNIGIAWTYNEPSLSFEFIRDTAPLIHEAGMVNVMVTNGFIEAAPLSDLLPWIDAWNIDVKTWDSNQYCQLGGSLETVKRTIEKAQASSHVEITSLIVPGENDSVDMMKEEALWIASLSPDIPLHITRFFPAYHMTDKKPTSLSVLADLGNAARAYLHHVNIGNASPEELRREGWRNDRL